MWWKTDASVLKRLLRLEGQAEILDGEVSEIHKSASEALHGIRQLDLDMVGLEDKVKAFTGRISVRKRKDRQPDGDPEPEKDLNQMIRDGELGI